MWFTAKVAPAYLRELRDDKGVPLFDDPPGTLPTDVVAFRLGAGWVWSDSEEGKRRLAATRTPGG